MDLDPEGIFRDDSDSDDEFYQEKEASKELVVYLVDASPKMFAPVSTDEGGTKETHFHIAINSILQSLKAQIIGRSYDEVAICFYNTKEKKNLQDLSGVYVFNVPEREWLDRPTARLIKEFSSIEESFMSNIGSRYWIVSGSRDNSLYNALWVAQALLRKGSAKTVSKRILLFTNEDDPFGSISGAIKSDMVRTTLQRAKDAQDLGISIELLPFRRPDEEFDVSIFYAELIGLETDEIPNFLPSARAIMWLDSVTNLPLKNERSIICADTGALYQAPPKRFQPYKNEIIKFSVNELSEIKKLSNNHLRLLGFKPLDCLKDYHNLRPSTFIFPTDESMLRLRRFALAFHGSSTHPQLVALVAQDEITSASGQVEPPGMHMIYLPYSDDIRHIEEDHMAADDNASRATDEQIKKASALLRRIDLKNFSVCQFTNPALQRHYGILQALALGEDEMPDIEDETVPDEEGMARPGIVNVIQEFKNAVYGENHDQEEDESAAGRGHASGASKKRKEMTEAAAKETSSRDWEELAENGKLKDLTVAELKNYLIMHKLPVTGKKETLISRILTHLGKVGDANLR
ncbi:ATP-dependent DNA helicase 2 subunit KU70, partial [Ananas comosus]